MRAGRCPILYPVGSVKYIKAVYDKNKPVGYKTLELSVFFTDTFYGRIKKNRRDSMRITNQMIARAAIKSGLPVHQNTLLNYMGYDNTQTANSLLSSLGNTKKANSALQGISRKNNRQLEASAQSLKDIAEKLSAEGEKSLFEKAKKTGDTSEIVASAEKMAESYNKTLKYLKGSDSSLNKFYLQELQSYTGQQSGVLKAVGITKNSDGSLSIQKETLTNADVDSLMAAFGSASGFSEKIGYVSGRVAENAAAWDTSYLSGYSNTGKEYYNAFAKGMYDFWG